ncbi:hypothetical protein J8J42_10975 [Chryseobacterium sp. cx-311]|uniref:hypothetical protein n=1 Tax=Marnyiella aurantia TaxID=2758037 RepID=UPI001AEB09DE|nr:hypothetical protein [Marnyiella aurantia]MBP0613568.1 hypothetical protein [Marnyiella aurantia]
MRKLICLISLLYLNSCEKTSNNKVDVNKGEGETTQTEFLRSNEPKTTQQKIDSAKLLRQLEKDNPDIYLQNLQKELEGPNLTTVEREEIEIEIKGIRTLRSADKNISSWDRSNPVLVKEVKKTMKDPDSFEHIETTFDYKKDKVIGEMQYRGTNSFGAKVISTTKGVFDYEGNLLSVE